jgi:hypothetical protein
MKTLSIAILAVLAMAAIPLAGLQGADPLQPQVVLPPAPVPGTSNVVPAPSAALSSYVAPTGPDAWRYKFHNGYWWYWTADNQWLYFANGQWLGLNTAPQPYVSRYESYDVAPQPQYVYPDYGDYGYPYYGGWGIGAGFGYGGWGHGGYGGGYGGHGGHHH